MTTKYTLTALDSFSCLADKCPDDCCTGTGWTISIDDEAKNKWHLLAKKDGSKAWLLDGICTNETGGKTNSSLCNDQDGKCFFINDDGLCRIHSELGPDYLTEACREYPRKYVNTPQQGLSTAMLSCPEIARLALLDNNHPVFQEITINSDKPADVSRSYNKSFSTHLEKIVSEAMALHKYALNLRLTYLARVLAELIPLAKQGNLSDTVIAVFSGNAEEHLQGLEQAYTDGEFSTHPVNGLHMWNLLRMGMASRQLFNACGIPDNTPIIQAALQADSDNDAREEFYRELLTLRNTNRQQIQQYENMFNRYLETSFMNQGFPSRTPDNNYIAAFLSSTFPFAAIQMLLWIRASITPRLDENHIIDTVYKVERCFSHGNDVYLTLNKSQGLQNIEHYFDWFLEVY